MKYKRKDKVHPSIIISSPPPSPSPSSSVSPAASGRATAFSGKDADSILKLLPVTILALALSLPIQDREVLAYLISRSIIVTNPSSLAKSKCRNSVKKSVPLFECGCFDCYTSFWYRWDSSPNREVIHQVIEAFEDHLVQNGSPQKHNNRGKKRGNDNKVMMTAGQLEANLSIHNPEKEPEITVLEVKTHQSQVVMMMPENNTEENRVGFEEEEKVSMGNLKMEAVVVVGAPECIRHKGLARKVLPDLLGLFNSRLWSLWVPGI